MEQDYELRQVRHYKDGETRDKKGRWAGKVVMVRKGYYDAIEELRKKTGMNKAEFWRMAVHSGVYAIAGMFGEEFEFPAEDLERVMELKSKRKFPAWLFQKRLPSNGWR